MPHRDWFREHDCDLAVNDSLFIFNEIYKRSNGDPCEGCGMRQECETFKLLSTSPATKESGLCQRCRKEMETKGPLAWFTKKGMTRAGTLCEKCEKETEDHRKPDGMPRVDYLREKGQL